MSATDNGFVRVDGTLEPKAIAAEIARGVHARIGEFLVLSAAWLENDGRPLNEAQRIHIAVTASRIFDGIEREALDVITENVKREAVAS